MLLLATTARRSSMVRRYYTRQGHGTVLLALFEEDGVSSLC